MNTNIMNTWDLPARKRVIVIGDCHGDLQRVVMCFYTAKIINSNFEWIAEPKDTLVVQVGDQVDSANRTPGVEPWEKVRDTELCAFLQKVDLLGRQHGGGVMSLIGNHELLNKMENFAYVSPTSMELCHGTLNRVRMFAPNGIVGRILRKRPAVAKVGSLLFCHAGLLPKHLDIGHNISFINMLLEKHMSGEPMGIQEQQLVHELFYDEDSILWTRKFMEPPNPQIDVEITNVLQRTNCMHMITGHNTVSNIVGMYDGKLWLVDAGLSRSYGGNQIQYLEVLDDGVPAPSNDFQPFRTVIITLNGGQ